MAGKKLYVVWRGKEPGIYLSWDECKKQVDGFDGASYKSFPDFETAKKAYEEGAPFRFQPKAQRSREKSIISAKPDLNSLCVDAACSGNPGVMEYRGVWGATGEQIFHQKYPLGTNNIGEFLALVHGLALMKQQNKMAPIYTDSMNAITWVRNKKCKTKLPRVPKTEELFKTIERAEKWLAENSYNTKILKWETSIWGEIPADFGRK